MSLSERIAHVLVIASSVLIVTGVLAAAFRAWFMTFSLFLMGFLCIVASCCLMSVSCLREGRDEGPGEGNGEEGAGERG